MTNPTTIVVSYSIFSISFVCDYYIIYETAISIKTVPDGCNVAMVTKISGKTQKVVQLIHKGDTTYTNASQTDTRDWFNCVITVDDDRLGGALAIRATGISKRVLRASSNHTNFAIKHSGETKDIYIYSSSAENSIPTYSGHVYVFSMNVTGCNPSTANGLKVNNITLFDLTDMGISTSGTDDEIISRLDSIVKNSYVSTGAYLWNTPVESVVSVGRNLFDYQAFVADDPSRRKITGENEFSVTGTYMGNSIIKLKPNTKHTILKRSVSSTVNVGMLIREAGSSTNLVAQYADGYNTFTTTSATEYTVGFYSGNATSGTTVYTNIMIYEGVDAIPYIPYRKTSVLVPSAVKNLPDYGLGIVKSDGTILANEVDFENGIYHHRVSQLDLGTLAWDWSTTSSRYYVRPNTKIKPTVGSTDVPNVLCPLYTTTSDGTSRTTDKTISVDTGSEIVIKDASKGENQLADFKAAMNGVLFIYELADSAKETIPLTDYIRPLPVENGGTLTLVNPHNLDVNNTVHYKKEVK